MNPVWHSESSVRHFGGKLEDYLKIHEKMDCHKAYVSDNRARVLTHTMFWVIEVMIPIFGSYITLESGRKVSVKDICERHILEDFKMKFIPTPQDFIQEMDFKSWMQNGNGVCPSAAKLYKELVPEEIKSEEVKPEKPEIRVGRPFRPLPMILDGTKRNRGGRSGYESKILD